MRFLLIELFQFGVFVLAWLPLVLLNNFFTYTLDSVLLDNIVYIAISVWVIIGKTDRWTERYLMKRGVI